VAERRPARSVELHAATDTNNCRFLQPKPPEKPRILCKSTRDGGKLY
jgi:hypothetical protein